MVMISKVFIRLVYRINAIDYAFRQRSLLTATKSNHVVSSPRQSTNQMIKLGGKILMYDKYPHKTYRNLAASLPPASEPVVSALNIHRSPMATRIQQNVHP